MTVHVSSGLHKHTARSTSWIEKFLITHNRMDNFHHILNYRRRSIKGSTTLTFRQGEVAKKIFVNLTEEIYVDILWNILEDTHDAAQQLRIFLWYQLSIHLFWQNILQFWISLFDSFHRLFHQDRLVGIIRCIVDSIEVSTFRKIESALLHSNVLIAALHASTFESFIFLVYFRFMLLEEHISITEKDKPKDRLPIFVWCQMGTRTQHICRVPKIIF